MNNSILKIVPISSVKPGQYVDGIGFIKRVRPSGLGFWLDSEEGYGVHILDGETVEIHG